MLGEVHDPAVQVAIVDLSQRKKAEKALLAAKEEAEVAVRELREARGKMEDAVARLELDKLCTSVLTKHVGTEITCQDANLTVPAGFTVVPDASSVQVHRCPNPAACSGGAWTGKWLPTQLTGNSTVVLDECP